MKVFPLLTSIFSFFTQTFAFSNWHRHPSALPQLTPRAIATRSRQANPSCLYDTANSDFDAAFQYNLRKNRLSATYKASSIAYGLYALHNLRAQTSLPYACLLASGHMLAAGLAYVLSKATANDQLFLFTSKRYNLALLEYGVCQLAVVALAGQIPGGNLFLLGPSLATISSIQGYALGVRGWYYQKPVGAIVEDVKKSTSQTMSSLVKVPKNIQSCVYLGATLLLATMKFVKFKEICEILLAKSDIRTSLLVPLARFGRLALFTGVVYSLKDAADRGFLNSSNLIQLNVLSSASFAALASYAGTSTRVGGLAAFFSIFCALSVAASVFVKND